MMCCLGCHTSLFVLRLLLQWSDRDKSPVVVVAAAAVVIVVAADVDYDDDDDDIIIILTFMQGIYGYITETNHVLRVCSVAAVLYL